jgi:hypothetical protein
MDSFLLPRLETMNCRADDAIKVIERRRFKVLRLAPFQREIAAVAGLRIERQNIVGQPIAQALTVAARRGTDSQYPTNGTALPASLAAIEFEGYETIGGTPATDLSREPIKHGRINLIMTFWKAAVDFHEL